MLLLRHNGELVLIHNIFLVALSHHVEHVATK